ncbi:putative F0F1-ATPase subunit (Ca2+/Mg2+ transporter) [Halanaerobium saccharolyticum]|uniref:Putative F0F1-ATPase subunit (Ca2+/Mg2+ transporter) n=1 Tax=Halanaerobium saccharolyticum TaxID=43595 RepID=A0A4R7Z940_9FIRM|nr:AtpZ/AtpI family protein [Halanaerobium saccharolyticum]RAK09824.1 putative F0F1-ATPase subunit (Ca2+/Mg2+ transporter) [Halanaerobium saccharolyticum]TDW07386.1 putative F0F1-ATPase subunit (Ca2+/Mg2+ transporter) [Halanaerobium saccharolyticum]TDX61265.1 putative F0F1-ATPase subunit (Ca2+/Mg2+ transporter) [Halanaerobium saccharolyticum]
MDNKNWHQIMRALSLLTEVGLVIVISAGIGFGLGYVIDNFFNFNLFFKLSGLFVGLAAGFYSVYKLLISTFDD